MKRLLLSSTSIVAAAIAAPASAQVAISGGAEFGILGGSGIPGDDVQFLSSIDDITFTMSGATDNGLTFGASIDLSDAVAGGAFANTTQGGETIFLSGNFGTINAGDVDGAMESTLVYLARAFGMNDDNTFHSGFNFNSGLHNSFDGQKFRYDYTAGGFTFRTSVELDDADTPGNDDIYDAALSWTRRIGAQQILIAGGAATGGIGGQNFDIYSISGSVNVQEGALKGLFVGAGYTDFDGFDRRGNGTPDESHWGVDVAYSYGNFLIDANYGVYDIEGGGDDSGFGLAGSYDLGGGASIVGAYGRSEPQTGDDTDRYSLGMSFAF